MSAQLSRHVDITVDSLALGRTRSAVARCLRDWGVSDSSVIHETVVVLSELIGNAVRHGGSLIAVELERRSDGVLISVLDTSPSLPQPREADETAESGRGMRLVAAFSAAWGAEPRRDGGKRVWALVPLPS
ncbi:MAG: putative histidine kinaserelated ATPase domain protein [Frankiales bacterium]|nr:putative histidine kinaserelated ATPase domain protein [Frankiales bacterium]